MLTSDLNHATAAQFAILMLSRLPLFVPRTCAALQIIENNKNKVPKWLFRTVACFVLAGQVIVRISRGVKRREHLPPAALLACAKDRTSSIVRQANLT